VAGSFQATAAILAVTAMAQPRTEFEVASIKPSTSVDTRTLVQVQQGGSLLTSNASLKFLLTLAYDVRSLQISGGPGWIDADRFDIQAKSNRGRSEDVIDDPRQVTEAQRKTMQAHMRRNSNRCSPTAFAWQCIAKPGTSPYMH